MSLSTVLLPSLHTIFPTLSRPVFAFSLPSTFCCDSDFLHSHYLFPCSGWLVHCKVVGVVAEVSGILSFQALGLPLATSSISGTYCWQGRFQDFRQGGVKKYFARRAKNFFLPPPILILPPPILILPPSL